MATTKKIQQQGLQAQQQYEASQKGTSGYINNQMNTAINQVGNVLAQKYNNPQFNPNLGFNEYQNPNGNTVNNANLQAQYNKYVNDYNNANLAQQQYQEMAQNMQDQQRQAGLNYQQAQKYAPGQLQAMGLGNTGLSETSQVGLMNTYQDILSRNQKQFGDDVNQMYRDLANSNQESNRTLEQEIANNDKQDLGLLMEGIALAPDEETLNKLMESYKGVSNPYSQIMYENKLNQFKKQKDQELYNKYNVDELAGEFDPETFNRKGYKTEGDNQKILIDLIRNNNFANKFENGTVLDLNLGKGTDKYVVINGRLFKVDNNTKSTYTEEQLIEMMNK